MDLESSILEPILSILVSILSILESILYECVGRPILIVHTALTLGCDEIMITIFELIREYCPQYFRDNFRLFDENLDKRVASVPPLAGDFRGGIHQE